MVFQGWKIVLKCYKMVLEDWKIVLQGKKFNKIRKLSYKVI